MSECIFKAGEEYQTREGIQARIYAIDCGGVYPIHGAVWYARERRWKPETWTNTGERVAGEIQTCDLIPPKRELWTNIYGTSDDVYVLTRKSLEDVKRISVPDPLIARVRIEYTPGQFDGEES